MAQEVENRDFFHGRLKLRHLVVIISVFEAGSTVKAAEQLLISQPAITRLLREAESMLGVPLFERTPTGMEPTFYTEIFLREARAALAHIRQGVRNIREFDEGSTGEVFVGAYLSGAGRALSEAIVAMKNTAPLIGIHIVERTPDKLLEMLADGELDFIVTRHQPSDSPFLPNGEQITFEPIYSTPAAILAHHKHPIRAEKAGSAVRLKDLKDYPWILPARETTLHKEVGNAFVRAGLSMPENYIICSNLGIMQGLLQHSAYLAVVPSTLFSMIPHADHLPVEDFEIMGESGILQAADHELSPAAQRFRQHLVETAKSYRN